MKLLGTEFRDALLLELNAAEKTIPYGNESKHLQQVRELINSPDFNFMTTGDAATDAASPNTIKQLLRSQALVQALIKLCDMNAAAWGKDAKVSELLTAEPAAAPGWGRSLHSWIVPTSKIISPAVQKAVYRVLNNPGYSYAELAKSDDQAADLAAELLELPEYKHNPHSSANKILHKFWSEQLQLRTAGKQRRSSLEPALGPIQPVPAVIKAKDLREAEQAKREQQVLEEQANLLQRQANTEKRKKFLEDEHMAIKLQQDEVIKQVARIADVKLNPTVSKAVVEEKLDAPVATVNKTATATNTDDINLVTVDNLDWPDFVSVFKSNHDSQEEKSVHGANIFDSKENEKSTQTATQTVADPLDDLSVFLDMAEKKIENTVANDQNAKTVMHETVKQISEEFHRSRNYLIGTNNTHVGFMWRNGIGVLPQVPMAQSLLGFAFTPVGAAAVVASRSQMHSRLQQRVPHIGPVVQNYADDELFVDDNLERGVKKRSNRK